MREPDQAEEAAILNVAKGTFAGLSAPIPGDTLVPGARPSAEPDLTRSLMLVANLLIIAAGAVVSLVPQAALSYHVFIGFLAGHAIWLGYAIARRERGLAALNAGLIALDCYAIAIRAM